MAADAEAPIVPRERQAASQVRQSELWSYRQGLESDRRLLSVVAVKNEAAAALSDAFRPKP